MDVANKVRLLLRTDLINILISIGGYVSFPDFENFVQHEHENDSGEEQQSSNS